MRTHEYLGFIAGRKSGEQGFASLFGLDAQIRRTPAEGLFDQAFDIPSPGQRHDLKQIGMLFDDAQRVDADGAVLPKRTTGRGKLFSHSDEGSSVI